MARITRTLNQQLSGTVLGQTYWLRDRTKEPHDSYRAFSPESRLAFFAETTIGQDDIDVGGHLKNCGDFDLSIGFFIVEPSYV
jgi:hypothetical protein